MIVNFNFIFLLMALSLTGQYSNDFNIVDIYYQEFNSAIDYSKDSSNQIRHEYFSEFPSVIFKTKLNATFGIDCSPQLNDTKLEAAIIHAISNSTHYKYVADLFDKTADQKRFVLKELLELKITNFPDTTSFIKTYQQKINHLETINQYSFKKTILLKDPIQVVYFTSTQETINGIEKIIKIKISQNNHTLYESTKRNQILEICYANNKAYISDQVFTYLNDSSSIQVRGGLWNKLLEKKLREISDKVFIKSRMIKQVNDIHSNLTNDLKRSISIGHTEQKQIKLGEFLLPKFENTIIFELENNQEKIVERYNEYYKKSEINLQNNIRHGFKKKWNTRGDLTKVAFYKDGELEGEYKEFYDDLTLKIETNYKNGKVFKSYRKYHENGKIAELYKYKNGQKHGLQKTFHDSGKLRQKGRYKKNQPTGWHYYYDSLGNRIKKHKFKYGAIKKTKIYN